MSFKLQAPYQPTGDQPQAIKKLIQGLKKGLRDQVLLGVTGSGKTFTIANVIEKIQKPTLIISHNKTLAAQLYQEFRDFFPQNAVCYFVSYYDYYQPEAYIPQTDTFIEKETEIDEEIDKLRLQTTAQLAKRKDVIVIASVSCIYNLGSPDAYRNRYLFLNPQLEYQREEILKKLTELFYLRSDYDLHRGSFRVRGENIDIYPAYQDFAVRLELNENKIVNLNLINPLSGQTLEKIDTFLLFPAKHFVADLSSQETAFSTIRQDLNQQVKLLKKAKRNLEAHRLESRVEFDLEQMREFGYVKGIENYSRYFDSRQPGDPPFSLLDHFPKDYLLVVDESHITIPQIRGMYNGDQARKQTLIDFGFRLPSARDNRPLTFLEFLKRTHQTIYTSATPGDWETDRAKDNPQKAPGVIQQLIRPTGIIDPPVDIRPTKNQVNDLIKEVKKRVKNGQRVLITTLTKRMAEDLTDFLKEKNLKVQYLHSEVQTLDRSDILDSLRLGEYDCLVGINLLREGLDLPEVSLVIILDADKEGFLRSSGSLIQVMGRAARHINGQVIMYADQQTKSMRQAIAEIDRRRQIQLQYNQKNHLDPQNIQKPIRQKLIEREKEEAKQARIHKTVIHELDDLDPHQLPPSEKKKLATKMRLQMRQLADSLEFELAAELRDRLREIEASS